MAVQGNLLLAKIPLLSMTDAMRKPISPREPKAVPCIEAENSDKGFRALADVFRAIYFKISLGFPPIA